MRPYRFKMRLSSKRLNVTRLGKGPAAAARTAARASLGSASSDIELMAPPVVSRHNIVATPHSGWLRGLQVGITYMIAPTAGSCKGAVARLFHFHARLRCDEVTAQNLCVT